MYFHMRSQNVIKFRFFLISDLHARLRLPIFLIIDCGCVVSLLFAEIHVYLQGRNRREGGRGVLEEEGSR